MTNQTKVADKIAAATGFLRGADSLAEELNDAGLLMPDEITDVPPPKEVEEYRADARRIIGQALAEIAPATSESLLEGVDPLTQWEHHAVVMLARLLRAIDQGDN